MQRVRTSLAMVLTLYCIPPWAPKILNNGPTLGPEMQGIWCRVQCDVKRRSSRSCPPIYPIRSNCVTVSTNHTVSNRVDLHIKLECNITAIGSSLQVWPEGIRVTDLKHYNLQIGELTAVHQEGHSLAGGSGQWHVTSATLGHIWYFFHVVSSPELIVFTPFSPV